tara:strand:+ start:269 stop:442 length:174 start_codon:yes stop_codon:yes gene_type:complete
MKKLDLKLSEYEIKLLINVINKELTILDNTELEKNEKEYIQLIDLKEYLIGDVILGN